MTIKNKKPKSQDVPEEVVDRLEGLLPADALERALEGLGPEAITGPGGLLTQLAGRVIDTALGAELTGHLGYPLGQAPPGGAGNLRNGSTAKTVHTELGPVQVNTPRDRLGSFDPQLVAKRQTRLAGLDDRVLDLYAGGMSVRDIASHLRGRRQYRPCGSAEEAVLCLASSVISGLSDRRCGHVVSSHQSGSGRKGAAGQPVVSVSNR